MNKIILLLIILLVSLPQRVEAQDCTTVDLLYEFPDATMVRSLATLGGGVLLAGTSPNGLIYRSVDNGISWAAIPLTGEMHVFDLLHVGNGVVLASTGERGNMYRSSDYGVSWSLVQSLRVGSWTNLNGMVHLGSDLLVGTTPAGTVYRSSDDGVSWSLGPRLGTQLQVLVLALSGNTLIAGTQPSSRIYRSTDDGLTWTLVQSLNPSATGVISLLPLGGGIVLAGTSTTGEVYRSVDNGLSFSLVQRLGLATSVNALLDTSYGVLAAANRGGIYRSVDNGLSWSVFHDLPENSYRLLDLGKGVVLAGTLDFARLYQVTMVDCPSPTPSAPQPTPTPAPTPIGVIDYPPALADQDVADLTIGMYAVMDHVVSTSMHPAGLGILSLIGLVAVFQTLRIFMIKRSKA